MSDTLSLTLNEIENAAFEKVLDKSEGTNFDFFIEMASVFRNKHVSQCFAINLTTLSKCGISESRKEIFTEVVVLLLTCSAYVVKSWT